MSCNDSSGQNQSARYDVSVGGTTFTADSETNFERLYVEDHVDMIGIAKISIGLGAEWSGATIGGDVELAVGGGETLFKGKITGIEHHWKDGKESMTVIAMDAMATHSASRNTKTWEESTDSDAVSDVLGGDAGTVDSTSGTWKWIFQRNESNLSFVRRLAARNGYQVTVNPEDGKIDFKAVAAGGAIEVCEEDIISLDWTMTDIGLPTEVTVVGWDYVAKEKVEGTGSSGEGLGGSPASATTWTGPATISDVWVNDQGIATSMAEAEFKRMARSFVRGRAVVQGNGALRAGASVKFSGNRSGFNVEGYIVSSRHIIEGASGFTTEVRFCSDGEPS